MSLFALGDTPHTSLPYSNMGFISVSKIYNINLGGRAPIFLNFLKIPKMAFRALSHKNLEFSLTMFPEQTVVGRMILPRYLYTSAFWITIPLNTIALLSFFPNTITLVFNSFTTIIVLEQNLCNPFNCFCRPEFVFDTNIKSSAHNIWATITSFTHTANSVSRYSLMSAMHFRNRRPLAIPPWFTPRVSRTEGLNFPRHFILKNVFSYKLRIVSITLPYHPEVIIL